MHAHLPYHLDISFLAGQVRGIGLCGENRFATGSRDKTVRLWACNDTEGHGYNVERTMVGHTSFVGPVAWISPNDELPKGGIVSGGMDTLVIVWDGENGNILYMLRGHELQVTSISVDEKGDILSASIDKYKLMIYFIKMHLNQAVFFNNF